MITVINKQPMPYILSNATQKAYDKIKSLIIKTFSLLKCKNEEKISRKKFYESYMDFARKLKAEGHNPFWNNYIGIVSILLKENTISIHHDFE